MDFADEYGAENLVVVLGAAAGEAAGLAAETVTAGDPTFAGPLTGVQLGLTVYHVCEPEMKAEFDEANVGRIRKSVHDRFSIRKCNGKRWYSKKRNHTLRCI